MAYGYSPYGMMQNPYMPNYQPMPQRQEITRVSGRPGAEAFQLPPNSSVLLLDETAPLVWLKQTDGACYGTITPYAITPYKESADAPDANEICARLEKLEAEIGSIKKQGKQARSGKPESRGDSE